MSSSKPARSSQASSSSAGSASAASRLLLGLAWLTIAAMFAVSIMRWFGPPSIPSFVGLVGVTPFVLAPAWIVLGFGVWSKRRSVVGLAAVLALAHVAWTMSDLQIRGSEVAANADHDVRLATGNLYFENDEPLVFVRALLAENPDVVFLQEVPTAIVADVLALPELAPYEWRFHNDRAVGDGSFVASRLPLTDVRVEDLGAGSVLLGQVVIREVATEFMNVHLIAPLTPDNVDAWQAQLRELSARVHQRRLPVILAGDFNATVHHRGFRELLDKGLTDAHPAVGRGFGFSWGPAFPGMAVMRIDHVLSTPEFDPVRLRQLDSFGSDHRPLVVDLQLR